MRSRLEPGRRTMVGEKGAQQMLTVGNDGPSKRSLDVENWVML